MALLPKSKKARRRLGVICVAGGVLVLAAALVIYALGDAVSFFYTPSQAAEANLPPGQVIQLGGLVEAGSVMRHDDGSVEFVVTDNVATTRVIYQGDLPDLFNEGQGVVTKGIFVSRGEFEASQVLAKHDESYMPRELVKALEETGEWRGEGAPPPDYGPASYGEGAENP
jgi:cytochrome c-type biogenesis protein CcmE